MADRHEGASFSSACPSPAPCLPLWWGWRAAFGWWLPLIYEFSADPFPFFRLAVLRRPYVQCRTGLKALCSRWHLQKTNENHCIIHWGTLDSNVLSCKKEELNFSLTFIRLNVFEGFTSSGPVGNSPGLHTLADPGPSCLLPKFVMEKSKSFQIFY